MKCDVGFCCSSSAIEALDMVGESKHKEWMTSLLGPGKCVGSCRVRTARLRISGNRCSGSVASRRLIVNTLTTSSGRILSNLNDTIKSCWANDGSVVRHLKAGCIGAAIRGYINQPAFPVLKRDSVLEC